MRAIGIRELKAKLSQYLRDVRRGEVVLVTDRGEVVAELRPPGSAKGLGSRPEDILELLAERGEITRARLPSGGWEWRPRGLGLTPGSAAGLLDELRGERGES